MTIKADHAEVCWEPVDVHTREGYWHNEDRWPHYPTRAAAAEAIAEIHRDRDPDHDEPLLLVAAPCFSGPCVVIVCNGCGAEFDYEGDDNGMHFDPAEPMPVPITDCEWSIEGDRHYCPDCPGSWCDDCGEQHHGGCPDGLQPVQVTEGQQEIPW